MIDARGWVWDGQAGAGCPEGGRGVNAPHQVVCIVPPPPPGNPRPHKRAIADCLVDSEGNTFPGVL